jgi:hypothetical protein
MAGGTTVTVTAQTPVPEEYLTVNELAGRLKLTPKTVRNRMYDGTWRRGVHWFRRPGIRPRFLWSRIVGWLQAEEQPVTGHDAGAAYGPDIPSPPRGRDRSIAP